MWSFNFVYFLISVCNPPQAPVNGDLRIPDEYFTAVYTCQTGYTINGPSLRTCQSDGSGWSGDDPICGKVSRTLIRSED